MTEPDARPRWAATGCMVGAPLEPCGEPLFGAVAVCTIPDVDNPDGIRPGVILLCRFHFVGLTVRSPG